MSVSGSAALRQAVQAFGDQFLAGPALADHQYRAAHGRGAARALDRVEEGPRLSDKLVLPLHSPSFSVNPQLMAILTVSP